GVDVGFGHPGAPRDLRSRAPKLAHSWGRAGKRGFEHGISHQHLHLTGTPDPSDKPSDRTKKKARPDNAGRALFASSAAQLGAQRYYVVVEAVDVVPSVNVKSLLKLRAAEPASPMYGRFLEPVPFTEVLKLVSVANTPGAGDCSDSGIATTSFWP